MSELNCPYCTIEISEPWDLGIECEGDGAEVKCPNCEKKFYATSEISYSSSGDCILNDEKHQWVEMCEGYEVCDNCDESRSFIEGSGWSKE